MTSVKGGSRATLELEDVVWELSLINEIREFVQSEPHLELTRHIFACPEVFEGSYQGVPYLFRERHGHWWLVIDGQIAELGEEPTLPGWLGVDHLRFVVALLRDRVAYNL